MKNLILSFSFLMFLVSCSAIKSLPKPQGVQPHQEKYKISMIKDLDPVYAPGKLPIGLSTPIIDGNKLITGTSDGKLLSIDKSTHTVNVILTLDAPIFSPVLIQDDMYYVATLDGEVIGWSKGEARIKYRVSVGGAVDAPLAWNDGRLVAITRNHSVVCLDALTGKVLWNYKRAITGVKTLQRRAGALTVGKYAVIGFADGYLVSFRLEDGNIQWETKVTEGESRHFQGIQATPVYFDGKILSYSYQGYLKVFKLDSGALEKTILDKPTTNLLIANNELYFGNILGDVVKLGTNFETVTKFSGLSKNYLYQIVYYNRNFILNDHHGIVYFLDLQDQAKIVQKIHLGHAYSTIFGSIEGDQSFLTFISSRNRLYLFEKNSFL